MKKNGDEREEALNTPMDGYELFMQFIVRQYRRGLRVRGGGGRGEGKEGGVARMRGGKNGGSTRIRGKRGSTRRRKNGDQR